MKAEEKQTETIQGTVISIVFQNKENGYTVARLTTKENVTITIVGAMPLCLSGEHLKITGHWEEHVSHGRQFRVETVERLEPTGAEAIEKYLASGAVKGIGPKTAERIVKIFGDETFSVMEQNPERLAEVPGISLQKAAAIGESFSKQFGLRKLLEFLLSGNLSGDLAMPLYRAYGDLAIEAVRDDPYILTEEFFGADFTIVDEYAIKKAGIAGDDDRRVQAGVLYNLRFNLNNGHTFLPADKLTLVSADMLHIPEELTEEAMEELHLGGKLVLDTLRERKICYLPEYYQAETFVAEKLLEMANTAQDAPDRLDAVIGDVQKRVGTQYAPDQLRAIEMAAVSSVMLLTGGPGTGKTTTVNGILTLFDRMELKTVLAAPTGRAANRLAELCGREAATIHRLLETQFDPETNQLSFMHDESEPLKADAVVVDETSMVDLLLMEALLRALKPHCRLILVGDPDQLPSVGAGNLLSDVLRSGKIPTVRLTEIFRQAQESLIIMNAHAINTGNMPQLTVKDKDFFFLQRRDMEKAVDTIVDLCARRLPQNMGIPAEQIQVLSPTRKNQAGTAMLNLRLQAALNPPSPEKAEHKRGKIIFRVGDRVMQIKNNYDIMWRKTGGFGLGSGVFNGDVGKITAIDPGEETVTVVYDDREVEYTFDLLGQLELAYAMTVHKSQGSEYRAVVLSVSQANPYLLTRSILYTAVTRAKELLILVGDPAVVRQMVENNRQLRRYSGLKLRLKKDG